MYQDLPLYAVGEPADMLASLQGKPSPMRNVHGFMLGNCGFASIRGLKLNTKFGRFLSKWEKEGNVPFSLYRDSYYGNSFYPKLKALTGSAVATQCMELKAEAYNYFIEKLNELLENNGFEALNLYVHTRID